MTIFRSVRFNIFLGALIALASALGTFLPQIADAPQKVDIFTQGHPQWSRLFDFFGLFNLYQSWWFMALLGLMAFDIAACKLWNTPPDHGLVALPPESTREKEAEKHLAQKEAALKIKPYQASLVSSLSAPEALERAKDSFASAGYHLHHEFTAAGGSAFVATRHRVQRWGSYLAHIGLVIILLGALIKGVYGFVEMVPVLEGRSRAMQNKPDWEVYVDKFAVRYYEGTMNPKSFSSQMRVQKGGKVLGAKTIYVNDPLDIGGVRFYQASWGAGGMFRNVNLRIGKQDIVLPQRTAKSIPGTPFQVEADILMPDFVISQDGRAETGSLDLKNPAVRFVFHVGPHKTSPLWLFENNPQLCFMENEKGFLSRAPAPPFEFSALDPVLFSGIQVAYDPGYKVVILGSIFWLLGMMSLFYLHRRRLWVLIEPGDEFAQVSIGAWSSRGGCEFKNEFEGLMTALREKMAARDLKIFRNPLLEVS